MAFTANTAFEIKVSNSVNNQTQNVPGKFGSFSGTTFTPADCSAGFLVKRHSLIPSEGYESVTNPKILNGNTWYMVTCASGAATAIPERPYSDYTGIYACNTHDVNKAASGSNAWNIGFNTLGLGIPAGERGNFTELIVGEQYKFGKGCFSTAPTSTDTYATISNGLLVATDDYPTATDGSIYFIIRREEAFNEGSSYAGQGYILEVARNIAVSSEE